MSAEWISRKLFDAYSDRMTLKLGKFHTKLNRLLNMYDKQSKQLNDLLSEMTRLEYEIDLIHQKG